MTEAQALRFAEGVAAVCDRTLPGATVVLHGSLTLGDFVAGRSDVDLLVVAPQPPSDEAGAALHEAVAAAPGRADVRVLTAATAAAPTPAPRLELGLGKHHGAGVEVEHEVNERDLAVELSVCRAHGRSLRGAAPDEVLAPLPDEWVLAAGDAALAGWERRPFESQYGELMVFTACRIWRFAEERTHCGKSEAAAWALARDPGLGVVADALASRARASQADLDEAGVRALLARARQTGAVARG